MSYQFPIIATLGDTPDDHLTSSVYVAEKRSLGETILRCESFEAAAQAVKDGKAEAALIAGAYPKIRGIIMDDALTCVDAFVEQIPPLVLCGRSAEAPAEVETVYLHPATVPLLPDLNLRFAKTQETRATSAAARLASGDSQAAAICNKLASDAYKLTVYQELRPALAMPFALFRKAVG